MPRGAKKDEPITKMLRANGLLLDRRSFVGYWADMTPHLYLFGDDMKCQRLRALYEAHRKCGICGHRLPEGLGNWELDHKKGGGFRRCDCLHNLQPTHRDCHANKHVQVKLQAVKDFDKLYPAKERHVDGH